MTQFDTELVELINKHLTQDNQIEVSVSLFSANIQLLKPNNTNEEIHILFRGGLEISCPLVKKGETLHE